MLFRHKTAVIGFLGLLFFFLGLTVFLTPLKEDILFFLPDEPQLAEQFSAFPLAPPARLIFLELAADGPKSAPLLDEAVRAARAKLVAPVFSAVHPAAALPHASGLMSLIPSLLSAEDAARYAQAATPDALSQSLPELKNQLLGLQGVVLKEFIPDDPLGMLRILFDRLRQTGLVPEKSGNGASGLAGFTPENGLPSPDGLARLLFVETPLPSMDAAGAITVTDALAQLGPAMPAGVSAHAISAHQQTAANVRTIKADMNRVLAASLFALAAIFLIWLRSFSSMPALALPIFALLGAWGLMALFRMRISGITLGFGAVLLGIVVDYALHVYCGMRSGIRPEKVTGALFRPLGFSFLTTAGAVSVLFFSDLPGMRQVGLFSLLGCAVGLSLALFILPLLFRPEPGEPHGACAPAAAEHAGHAAPRIRLLPFCLFMLFVAVSIWAGKGVTMQGNLRSLGVQDPQLIQTERDFNARWGQGFRQSAILLSKGTNTEDALSSAQTALRTLQETLRAQGGPDWAVTPLPLVPPPAQQAAARDNWRHFVSESAASLRENLGPGGEAGHLGFSGTAFAPFLNRLAEPPRPITPEMLDQAGLGLLRALFLPPVGTGGKPGRAVLSLVPDKPALLEAARQQLPEGSLIVSTTAIGERISAAVREDFGRMGLAALAVVALCLAAAMRSVNGFLLACVPSLCGCSSLLLIFGLGGQPMNLFTVAAMPLVMGLCAEYGIFMARHMADPDAASTPKAILLSGLTTLTGFGSLLLADHPALHTLGLTVGAGVGVAIPAALWLLPFLAGKKRFA